MLSSAAVESADGGGGGGESEDLPSDGSGGGGGALPSSHCVVNPLYREEAANIWEANARWSKRFCKWEEGDCPLSFE